MTFLEVMDVMLELQDKFPGMSWDVVLGVDDEIKVMLPVSPEVADLFVSAKSMFEPID